MCVCVCVCVCVRARVRACACACAQQVAKSLGITPQAALSMGVGAAKAANSAGLKPEHMLQGAKALNQMK